MAVVGNVPVAKIKLLQDMVVDGAVRSVGDVIDLPAGEAALLTHGKRAEYVSVAVVEKQNPVGSVAAPAQETKEVLQANTEKPDVLQVPLDAVVVAPAATTAKATKASK